MRTAAEIAVTALIVDSGSTPMYPAIGDEAAELREFGMSDRAIARALHVSDKTVAKSVGHSIGADDGPTNSGLRQTQTDTDPG
ncbi:MAG: hypothetical protein ABSH51_30240 [Solirubrobacteraceae bacterium]|jgi:hypothetical protein